MELYRIGEKIISTEKIMLALSDILVRRANGATQQEVANDYSFPRSFISNLESLGEIRKGPRVALIAFPVSNGDEVRDLAKSYGVDFTLVFSQAERKKAEGAATSEVFNQIFETLAELEGYGTLILAASNYRIETFRRILNLDVLGIELGSSPIKEDQVLDLGVLKETLDLIAHEKSSGREASRAHDLVERWRQLRK